jgi:pimeloyl-ACP methyl ester carboxylesterase
MTSPITALLASAATAASLAAVPAAAPAAASARSSTAPSSTAPSSTAPSSTAPAGPLDWGRCPKDSRAPGLECATLAVPLDYRDPGGRTIDLAVSRMAAADPAERRGVLLTNTGGPGGVGLSYPGLVGELGMSQKVLDRYDVIGFDPRGVGRSTPVTCDLSLTDQPTNIPTWARNAQDVRQEAKRVARVAKKCGRSETADLLPHITTANTARDMDRIRQALGEETISYYGVSYGTYLGAVYTSLFPEQSDRFLLDSSTGPDGWDQHFTRQLGAGVEQRFPDFARYVSKRPELGLGRTPAQVRATYLEIARKLDRTPSPQGIDGAGFRQATFAAFYYSSAFPKLAAQWQAFDRGTPVPVADPSTDGPFGAGLGTKVPTDNYIASQLHVICGDQEFPEDVSTYVKAVAKDRQRHPLFGAAAANIMPCASWPTDPVEAPVEITDDGPSNVLIIQNRRDPATPLAGARKMRAALGDRARMVTVDQGGHLSYLFTASTCANGAGTKFLAAGKRPAQDRTC